MSSLPLVHVPEHVGETLKGYGVDVEQFGRELQLRARTLHQLINKIPDLYGVPIYVNVKEGVIVLKVAYLRVTLGEDRFAIHAVAVAEGAQKLFGMLSDNARRALVADLALLRELLILELGGVAP